MIKCYEHTQINWILIIIIAVGLVRIGDHMTVYGFDWMIAFAALIISGVFLALFATLKVVIEGDASEIRFGLGFIRKKIHLTDIESCHAMKNPWYEWGIRPTRHGWIYSVSGSSAVEIKMRTGQKYRIGTDVPNDLEKAIRQSIERT